MKAVLLRVGIAPGYGGIHSPLFKDETFEFIPIPEYYNKLHKGDPIDEKRTYSAYKGTKGKPFIDYFKKEGKDKEAHRDCIIHLDPEFETFTYGDPNITKNTLSRLNKGDYLIFYAGLEGYDFEQEPALYVIGYFEVEYSLTVTDISHYKVLLPDFKNNFHVMHKKIFERDVTTPKNKGLKLVKGTKNSQLLKYPVQISQKNKRHEHSSHSTHLISEELQHIFGDFGGKISIQRNPLRWITKEKNVRKTVAWLKSLK